MLLLKIDIDMGLTAYLNHTPSKLSFFAWNINGLSSKSLGDKLQNVGWLNVINGYDCNPQRNLERI